MPDRRLQPSGQFSQQAFAETARRNFSRMADAVCIVHRRSSVGRRNRFTVSADRTGRISIGIVGGRHSADESGTKSRSSRAIQNNRVRDRLQAIAHFFNQETSASGAQPLEIKIKKDRKEAMKRSIKSVSIIALGLAASALTQDKPKR